MSIDFSPLDGVFHLRTHSSSYLIKIVRDRYLSHVGWFHLLPAWEGASEFPTTDRGFSPNPFPDARDFSLDTLAQEYPTADRTDFRNPAIEVVHADGSVALDLWYRAHRILSGKPSIEGLPSTYVESADEADTLEIDLADSLSGLTVTLSYTVWRNRDAIARSARVTNGGSSAVTLEKVLSANLDFAGSDYTLMQLSGSYSRERFPEFRKLASGMQGIGSRRGSSSHHQNPFIALLAPGCGEDSGEAFGFSLVYSGSFDAEVEVDHLGCARVSLGISPHHFSWKLAPGETFRTPEAVMVRSESGLGGMSRIYHDLYRERLCRGAYRDRARTIVANNWEATYFKFSEKKLLALADEAKAVGIETFVLDDGWFGKRESDLSSLGDWVANAAKLPGGSLDAFGKTLASRGLAFGLWVEPEMVSPDSDLYRSHPDWCLHVEGRSRSVGRSQLVLDLSRADVRAHLTEVFTGIFSSAPISFVKWDMNRNMTEVGSALAEPDRQRETSHRYMLGLYEILETLTEKFPHVLFESCSGGGGRYDPGMLHYMPQTWTSDNTDAVSRVWIQLGTSVVYPASTMSCHVSAVPNHQVGRVSSMKMRGDVAMNGAFGYELDLTSLSAEEKKEIAAQVASYKRERETILFGDMYRLVNPWDNPAFASWMTVSKNRKEAFVTCVWLAPVSNGPWSLLMLKGLDPDARYFVDARNASFTGAELMHAGLGIKYDPMNPESLRIRLSVAE